MSRSAAAACTPCTSVAPTAANPMSAAGSHIRRNLCLTTPAAGAGTSINGVRRRCGRRTPATLASLLRGRCRGHAASAVQRRCPGHCRAARPQASAPVAPRDTSSCGLAPACGGGGGGDGIRGCTRALAARSPARARPLASRSMPTPRRPATPALAARGQVKYVKGIDLSPAEIREAERRYNEMKERDRGEAFWGEGAPLGGWGPQPRGGGLRRRRGARLAGRGGGRRRAGMPSAGAAAPPPPAPRKLPSLGGLAARCDF
jgi:hypothetical protein